MTSGMLPDSNADSPESTRDAAEIRPKSARDPLRCSRDAAQLVEHAAAPSAAWWLRPSPACSTASGAASEAVSVTHTWDLGAGDHVLGRARGRALPVARGRASSVARGRASPALPSPSFLSPFKARRTVATSVAAYGL
eukprot:CAMPEP_0183372508 /NCGR_PEP_ID=MMETSP0164_2-20130417/108628_1 /TAXON_ID=221442 /ORGANISM="Coccolithus pelagicus ssp braarudi, Strain PLY182g" /LENGTH=137 /DNA_ID=CAMNT_0025549219 /DNA_START=86 /DNA_END=498 /DNA_ORIENTATION=-